MPTINGQKVACSCTHEGKRPMMAVRRAGRPLTTCPHNPGSRCDCRPEAIAAAANTTPLQTARSRGATRAETGDVASVGTASAAPEFTPEWTSTTISGGTDNHQTTSFSAPTSSYLSTDAHALPSTALDPRLFDVSDVTTTTSLAHSADTYSGWATSSTSTSSPWLYDTGTISRETQEFSAASQIGGGASHVTGSDGEWPPLDASVPLDQNTSFSTYVFADPDSVFDESGTQEDNPWSWVDGEGGGRV
ncbi:hypothetical protein B0T16DRAFT_115522 [Cercophora newfieldiana]|uniref:Copper-fist domain-containing protein n=1 Tax=Cercophora newfieldiana TaxID=92897 RepID=A0AA39Y9D8_9PEZI|nr:hypothetical protein B0T16DRAFT_115522 [Cercophora newfieldiana]